MQEEQWSGNQVYRYQQLGTPLYENIIPVVVNCWIQYPYMQDLPRQVLSNLQPQLLFLHKAKTSIQYWCLKNLFVILTIWFSTFLICLAMTLLNRLYNQLAPPWKVTSRLSSPPLHWVVVRVNFPPGPIPGVDSIPVKRTIHGFHDSNIFYLPSLTPKNKSAPVAFRSKLPLSLMGMLKLS